MHHSITFLLLDLTLPLGIATGVLYTVVMLFGIWFPIRNQVVFIMLLSFSFVIIGYYLSPGASADNWAVIFNRALAMFAIVSTAGVVYFSKKWDEPEQVNHNEIRGNSFSSTISEGSHSNLIHRVGFNGIVIAVPILLMVIGTIFWVSSKVNDSQAWVSHTHEVQTSISQVLSTLQDAETGQRGYLLTRNPAYLAPFTSGEEQIQFELAMLEQLTIDNPKQQNNLKQVYLLVGMKMDELRESIVLLNTQGQESALKLVKTNKGKEVMDNLRGILSEMRDEEHRLLVERSEALEKVKVLALTGQTIGVILLILISTFVVFRTRDLLVLQAKAESSLRHMANHDSLTGLATRHLGMEHLSFACSLARRSNCKAAVLFIDLDGFKAVNDTFGHDTGDNLLVGVAERLLCSVREVDTVVRIGGDEFMIVLSSINNNENTIQVAQKIIDSISQPFLIGDQNVSIGASIGIALYPDHAQEPETLIKCADDAMYVVKSKGKNQFIFAEAAMKNQASE